jgi:hypothetical protein
MAGSLNHFNMTAISLKLQVEVENKSIEKRVHCHLLKMDDSDVIIVSWLVSVSRIINASDSRGSPSGAGNRTTTASVVTSMNAEKS